MIQKNSAQMSVSRLDGHWVTVGSPIFLFKSIQWDPVFGSGPGSRDKLRMFEEQAEWFCFYVAKGPSKK